jgi:hypothetical protein
MQEKNYTGIIPENITGKEITADSSSRLSNADAAKALYETARDKLLHVHDWKALAGDLSAEFQLTDQKGMPINRGVQRGDYFQIDIPGPGSNAGQGYDWARVEDVKEVRNREVDSIAIRVRPASDPRSSEKNVAHFYSGESSSTFVITRENQTVTASVYDRNIEANEKTGNVVDKVRNTLVGIGAKLGISKLQWQALTDALVKTK